VSRPPDDLVAEAGGWHARRQELLLVSENCDLIRQGLGDLRLLEALLPKLARSRHRPDQGSYLHPPRCGPG